MTLLDEVLQANQAYLEHTQEVNTWSKYPQIIINYIINI